MSIQLVRHLLSIGVVLAIAAFAAGQETPSPTAKPMFDPTELKPLAPEQYADDASSERTADEIEALYPPGEQPEAVRMLVTILRKSDIGPNGGWFGPAQTRYTWPWLAERCGLAADAQAITREQFPGPDAAWKVLDRNGDGSIMPSDLDWSPQNPWVQQAYLVSRLFRRMNAAGNGRLSRAELDKFFEAASGNKDHLTLGDFRDALLTMSYLPGDDPSRETLVRGFFANELGSLYEGPRLNEPAPDFALKTPDGDETYELSNLVGQQPVVLVLGNFTCGPFRAFYPEVDAVFEKQKDGAKFLMVYVREAHPTDGWKMESNTRSQVAVAQPKTLAERAAVCDQFCERLAPGMPVVVDDVTDKVGNAYSGMPARMYVIDTAGKVAYQSGRGPFGFKVGEMEQALWMARLEGAGDRKK
jgi:hypothetical protein